MNESLFLSDIAAAREQNGTAQQALSSGQWYPSPAERSVAGDLWLATRRPPIPLIAAGGSERAALWQELDVLARWAPAIRLAMKAGGWGHPGDAGVPGFHGSLPSLLASVYGPARIIERWEREHHGRFLAGARPMFLPSDKEDADLAEHVPGIADILEAADRLFWGQLGGGVSMTLHVTATGDVDD